MASPLLRTALRRNAKRIAAVRHTSSTPHPFRPRTSTSHSDLIRRSSSRPIFNWARKPTVETTEPETPDHDEPHLFYPLSQSPHPDIRARSHRISSIATCPVCVVTHADRTHVAFECPDCGFPTHCSEEHWAGDAEHGKYCDRLREANEDEHDLRSGRPMTEFRYNSRLFSHRCPLLHFKLNLGSLQPTRIGTRRSLSRAGTYSGSPGVSNPWIRTCPGGTSPRCSLTRSPSRLCCTSTAH